MKALVIYDSQYGNTEIIAKAIGSAFSDEVKVLHVKEVNLQELQEFTLLIIGSPTQGGRPTKAIQSLLNNQQFNPKGVKITAFDTRGESSLIGFFGYAAIRIADNLQKKGSTLIKSPMGFYVKSTKGPLREGEGERAKKWAEEIKGTLNNFDKS